MSAAVISMRPARTPSLTPHELEQMRAEFLVNARALHLTEAEALEACSRADLQPFWPVPFEGWDWHDEASKLASDRAHNALKNSPAYDAQQAARALKLELNGGAR